MGQTLLKEDSPLFINVVLSMMVSFVRLISILRIDEGGTTLMIFSLNQFVPIPLSELIP